MKKIDISKWEPFTLDFLFDVVKGSRLTKQNMKEGSINYIGATAFNNGITNKIGNNEHIHPAGTLTVAYNGSIGQTFYQEEPFWATDDVNVLYPKFRINKYIAMFMAPLIRSIGRNYVYTDKWQIEDMRNSTIYLPVIKTREPDWEYMDSYMRNIDIKVQNTINQLSSIIRGGKNKALKLVNWDYFNIGKYFIAKNTGNILNRDIIDGTGNTPYVTASGVNNGVVAYIDASKYDILKGNCILVGGKTFTLTYQKYDFVSNDSHNFTLTLTENVANYEDVYLFLITILRCSLSKKYSWGDAVTKEKMLKENILLPSTKHNTPDWEYMGNFTKTMKNKAISNNNAVQY